MARSSAMLMCGTVSMLLGIANANGGFFRGVAEALAEHEGVGAVLPSELAETMGGGLAKSKLPQLEEVLRPMFNSLPKNEHGNIGRAVVGYALQRFFVEEHGWSVKNLELAKAGQTASSPTAILKGLVPAYVETLFEQHLDGRGFGLRELAVLAATLEHLVHDEAMERLQASYQAHNVLPTDLVTEDNAKGIIEVYLAAFIFDKNLSSMSRRQMEHFKRGLVPTREPRWVDTHEWLNDMRLTVRHADRGVRNPFVGGHLDFPRIARVVEEMDDRYGRFQDIECQNLKRRLLVRERQIPGRVLLSDFWKKGGGFTESREYLRQMGALDESDPKMPPSVVVPNYINAKATCLAGLSSFYSICCINECEGLMRHLERGIAMPTAEPQRVAALVASMPSDTIDAPRNLSATLLSRLDAIAERHAGRVPLHGRLFAQWMHHAYPNECTYPQTQAETGTEAASIQQLDRHSMASYVNNTADVDELLLNNYDLPWMHDENLLEDYEQVPLREEENGFRSFVRKLGLLVTISAMVVSMTRAYSSADVSLDPAKLEKYSV